MTAKKIAKTRTVKHLNIGDVIHCGGKYFKKTIYSNEIRMVRISEKEYLRRKNDKR